MANSAERAEAWRQVDAEPIEQDGSGLFGPYDAADFERPTIGRGKYHVFGVDPAKLSSSSNVVALLQFILLNLRQPALDPSLEAFADRALFGDSIPGSLSHGDTETRSCKRTRWEP